MDESATQMRLMNSAMPQPHSLLKGWASRRSLESEPFIRFDSEGKSARSPCPSRTGASERQTGD